MLGRPDIEVKPETPIKRRALNGCRSNAELFGNKMFQNIEISAAMFKTAIPIILSRLIILTKMKISNLIANLLKAMSRSGAPLHS